MVRKSKYRKTFGMDLHMSLTLRTIPPDGTGMLTESITRISMEDVEFIPDSRLLSEIKHSRISKKKQSLAGIKIPY
jgi:hypothetical protein